MSIPDNLDRFTAHEREKQRWLDTLPRCEHCDEPIQDDYLIDFDGVLFHLGCAEQEFKKPTSNYTTR